MTRSKRLETVHGVVNERVEEAARELAASRERWQRSRDQLEELRRYSEEYRGRLNGTARAVGAFSLRDYRAFVARIDGAVREQELQVRRSELALERSRERWLEARRRAEAIGHAVDRCREHERREGARREQRQMEDLVRPRRSAHLPDGRMTTTRGRDE